MGAISKLQAYLFAALLAKDFKKWDAYNLGVMDEKGKIIKKPKTPEERKSMDVFENLVRKIKTIILKFAPNPKYLSFIMAAYLLKENTDSKNMIIKKELDKILSENEINEIIEYLKVL